MHFPAARTERSEDDHSRSSFESGRAFRPVRQAVGASLEWFTTDGRGASAAAFLILGGLLVSGCGKKSTSGAPVAPPGPAKLTPRSTGPVFTPNARAAIAGVAAKQNLFSFDPFDPQRMRPKLSPAEVRARTITYKKPNVTIVSGLCGFKYYVCTAGDEKARDTERIRLRLSKLRAPGNDFTYLASDEYADPIQGFNVGGYAITKGAWIPIPLRHRTISDKEFSYHASVAIDEMCRQPRYKAGVEHMLASIGRDELTALMVATAKKECGPYPIGYCQGFRSERFLIPGVDKKGRKFVRAQVIYSYGPYQILYDGHGKNALNNLNLSVSQTRHPVAASKQYLAFLLEKSGAVTGDYTTLDNILPEYAGWEDRYARFYNGPKAKPDYARDILAFRSGVFDYFDGKPPSVANVPPRPRFESALEPRIEALVRRYHGLHGKSAKALRPDEHSAWYVKVVSGPGIDPEKGKVIVSINGNKVVPAGSMNKVQVAIAFFTAVNQKTISYTVKDAADLSDMLVHSNNEATDRVMKRVGFALGAKTDEACATSCEDLLRKTYPGMFLKTELRYIPTEGDSKGRAYGITVTVREFSDILEGLARGRFPYSNTILGMMNHPGEHNRLVKGTQIVSKLVTKASGKTGTQGIMIGDGQLITARTKTGAEFTYTIVGIVHRAPKKRYQTDEATMNLQTRANRVLRGTSDITYEYLAASYGLKLPALPPKKQMAKN